MSTPMALMSAVSRSPSGTSVPVIHGIVDDRRRCLPDGEPSRAAHNAKYPLERWRMWLSTGRPERCRRAREGETAHGCRWRHGKDNAADVLAATAARPPAPAPPPPVGWRANWGPLALPVWLIASQCRRSPAGGSSSGLAKGSSEVRAMAARPCNVVPFACPHRARR